MIMVIFEVRPFEEKRQDYLDIAASLKEHLQNIDGFISVERFQSLTDPDKLLSLSCFRDEKAIEAWRKLSNHRQAQTAGRETLFSDYRIRVAQVLRDYSLEDRTEAPLDSQALHQSS